MGGGRDPRPRPQAQVTVERRGLDQGLRPLEVACPGQGHGLQRPDPDLLHQAIDRPLGFVGCQPPVEMAGVGEGSLPVVGFDADPIGRSRREGALGEAPHVGALVRRLHQAKLRAGAGHVVVQGEGGGFHGVPERLGAEIGGP